MATPLTVSWPFLSQQTTWSPGRPMTRLMRWSSESSGSSPTNCSTRWIVARDPDSVGAGANPSQLSGSLKTTTSPRLRSNGPGVSLLTMTRSSRTRVFSIEPDGM